MSSDNVVGELSGEIQRLEELLGQEIRRTQRSARRSAVVTASIGVIVLVFCAINYFYIRGEWTEENLSRSVEKEIVELRPTAGREIDNLQREVLPVYVDETKRQLASMGPQMAARLEDELESLTREILQGVHDHLIVVQDRVLAKSEAIVFQTYPDLKHEAQREQLGRRFHEAADGAVAKLIVDFDGRFGKDVARVQETLWKFDLSDSDEAAVDLQKNFIRLWLRILDQEIMEL